MNIIEAHNINYSTSNKVLFKDITIDIEKGSYVSIIGENGVGKTTLLRLLSGSLISDNNIKIDGIQVNKFNVDEITKKSAFITSYNEFFSKTVLSEILQDRKSVSSFDINKVKKMLDEFNLLYLENYSPQKLSYAENQIVALIKAILKESKIIFLDNAFSKLDFDKRYELLNYIKKISKQKDITIVSTTNDVKELALSDRIIYINNKKVFFDGNYDELITNEDINIKLPWEIEVSDKLIMYELLDKRYDNMDDIIGELCK
ncbi:MAG: ABC transporter ATP-binding protein [Bacilli bacterium]|nr:ABC transporter ATP-binding protein [Bacilli bacterium]